MDRDTLFDWVSDSPSAATDRIRDLEAKVKSLRGMISCEEVPRDCAKLDVDPPDKILSRCLSCQIELMRCQRDDALRELQQFCDVAGLDPVKYPGGRRLPDPALAQDPAFLAQAMGRLEDIVRSMESRIPDASDRKDCHPPDRTLHGPDITED